VAIPSVPAVGVATTRTRHRSAAGSAAIIATAAAAAAWGVVAQVGRHRMAGPHGDQHELVRTLRSLVGYSFGAQAMNILPGQERPTGTSRTTAGGRARATPDGFGGSSSGGGLHGGQLVCGHPNVGKGWRRLLTLRGRRRDAWCFLTRSGCSLPASQLRARRQRRTRGSTPAIHSGGPADRRKIAQAAAAVPAGAHDGSSMLRDPRAPPRPGLRSSRPGLRSNRPGLRSSRSGQGGRNRRTPLRGSLTCRQGDGGGSEISQKRLKNTA
jgi:hypothetical protein